MDVEPDPCQRRRHEGLLVHARPFRIRGGCWRPANVVVPERLCMRDQRLTALASREESHGPAMLVTPKAQVIHMVIGASSHR